jgi:hypothetical protein
MTLRMGEQSTYSLSYQSGGYRIGLGHVRQCCLRYRVVSTPDRTCLMITEDILKSLKSLQTIHLSLFMFFFFLFYPFLKVPPT